MGPGKQVETRVAERREWTCACGQAYLVTEGHGEERYWPRSGTTAYSRHGLTARCPCIRCGRKIV